MKITKDTLVCELLAFENDIVKVIEENQLAFLLCPTCQLETLEEISIRHGIDIEILLNIFKG